MIILLRLLVVTGAVASLELACRTGLISPTVIIAPSQMLASLWQILQPGSGSYPDIIATFSAVAIATGLAVIAGFAAGVAVHGVPRLRDVLTPLLDSYYAVPTFMFYPIFIVLLGAGRGPIIAIAFLLAVVAMLTGTLAGLDRIAPAWRRTARVFRLGWLQTAVLIVLPGAAPQLFTGLKLAVAYAFIGVIASEFILSGEGLGYAIATAYNNFDNRTMYGMMLLIVIVVSFVNLLLHGIDQRLRARFRR